LPIYRDTLDDPVGMVHIKDVIGVLIHADGSGNGNGNGNANGHKLPLYKLKRDVLFVPPSMPVADLLLKMQTSRQHMALVIDEYGGTDGLVTIEDLVEEIVGDIEDEHDVAEKLRLRRRPDGSFDADARVEIEEFEEFSGLELRLDPEEEEVDTLGGVVFSILGRVPQRGEVVRHPKGLEIRVVDADARRIRKLQIYKLAEAETGRMEAGSDSLEGGGAGGRSA
jgi:CBS domain containing-hemolysin-like protein